MCIEVSTHTPTYITPPDCSNHCTTITIKHSSYHTQARYHTHIHHSNLSLGQPDDILNQSFPWISITFPTVTTLPLSTITLPAYLPRYIPTYPRYPQTSFTSPCLARVHDTSTNQTQESLPASATTLFFLGLELLVGNLHRKVQLPAQALSTGN